MNCIWQSFHFISIIFFWCWEVEPRVSYILNMCYFKPFYLFEVRTIGGIENKTAFLLEISIVASFFFSELFCSQVAFSSQCLSRLVCTVVLFSRPSLFCILSITFLTIACDVVFTSSEDNCLFSYCELLVYLCLTRVPRLTTRGTSMFWQAWLVFMRLCSCCGHPVLWSWKAHWPVGPFPSTRHMVFKRIVCADWGSDSSGFWHWRLEWALWHTESQPIITCTSVKTIQQPELQLGLRLLSHMRLLSH